MLTRFFAWPLLLAGASILGSTVAVLADDPTTNNTEYASSTDEDLPVMARPRPEFDPKGIKLGGFRLFPTVNVLGTYDSNIDRVQSGTLDDFIVDVTPSFRLQSQWADDMLEVYGGTSNYLYLQHSEEDLTDWNVGGDGRYDIERGTSVYMAGQAAELHELRSSPNTVGFQASATRYHQYHAEVDATVRPNRLGFTGGFLSDSYDYENAPLLGGGILSNGDRDFSEYQAYSKAFYDFSPGYSGFLRILYDTRQFDQYLDRSGLHRSSNGYRLDGGIDFQLTHLVSGEVYLGYLGQNFTTPLPNVNGLDYNLKLDWLATPLLTVHLQAARSLSQVVLIDASVSDDHSVGLSADYEFLRNILVRAHVSLVNSSFPGIARHDRSPDTGLDITYLIDEHLSAEIGYSYNGRDTNLVGLNYQDSLFTIGIMAHD